jgi:peroxiredoxin
MKQGKCQMGFRLLIVIMFTIISITAGAQQMPGFKMQTTGGGIFSSSNIPSQKPVVLIYFAPDCEHCQVLMNELFKKIQSFKKAELVLVTFEPVKELVAFEKKYAVNRYKNIHLGSEQPVFFFRTYYQLEHTPFTALFDKKHKLVISYKDYTPVDDLIKHLKALSS